MRKSFNFKLSSLPADAKKEMKDILQDQFFEIKTAEQKRKKLLTELTGKKNV